MRERQLIRRISEVELNCVSLSASSRLVWYGGVRQLSYEGMMVGCHGNGLLVWVLMLMIEKWFGLGILHLILNMELNAVLELVVLARVAGVDRAAMPDQEWFSYDYAQGMLVLSPGRCGD